MGERSPARCAASAGSLLAGDNHVHRCSWPAAGPHVHHCECGTDWTEITRTEHDRIAAQLARVDPYDSTKGFSEADAEACRWIYRNGG
jgi:hypothetical protein